MSAAPTMRAAFADRYGGPEVVRLRDVPRPVPEGDQVLLRVHVASVNRADMDGLAPKPGFLRLFMGLRAPRRQEVGVDAAGVVEAVGPDVRDLRPGDRVMSDLYANGRMGAFAEYVAAREKALARIPDAMSFADAATLPHSGILAIQSMRLPDGRAVGPASRVLIDGASGNVGPFAVQIAKALGAEVTGVASGDKLDFVRSLGADRVIGYETDDYTRGSERYDWIVAVDTHHSLRAARRALTPDGVYITLGGGSGAILAGMGGNLVWSRFGARWSGLLLWWKPMHRPDMDRLLELIAAGAVTPRIDRRFPLDQVVDALRWVDEGRARGKVLLDVAAG